MSTGIEGGLTSDQGDEEELDRAEAKSFRGVAARLNFLGLDSPDLQFQNKDSQKDMGKPMVGSWRKLKKVGRYLINHLSKPLKL